MTMTVWTTIMLPTFTVVALIGILTFRATKKANAKKNPATTAMLIPIVGALCAVMTGVFSLGLLFVRQYQRQDCLNRAGRSEKSYIQTQRLYNVIDEATHTTVYTSGELVPGQPSLRQSLEETLSPLAADDCPKV